jgi:hypothetical protein
MLPDIFPDNSDLPQFVFVDFNGTITINIEAKGSGSTAYCTHFQINFSVVEGNIQRRKILIGGLGKAIGKVADWVGATFKTATSGAICVWNLVKVWMISLTI